MQAQTEQKWLAQGEFGGIVGATRQAVNEAVRMGRFAPAHLSPQGFILYPDALRDWHENRDTRGGGRKHGGGGDAAPRDLVSYDTKSPAGGVTAEDDPAAGAPTPPAAGSPAAPPSNVTPITAAEHIQAQPGTLAYERIEMAKLKRQKFEREEAIAAGRYVLAEDVEAGMVTMMREFREVIRQLPGEADEIVAMGKDVEKVRKRLRLIATRTLETLQAKMKKLAEDAAKGAAGQASGASDDDDEDDYDDQE